MMSRVTRGCAFCLNEKCENDCKGVFLLNYIGEEWFCDLCHMRGRLVSEEGSFAGEGKFNQVRIEFDYDPHLDRYNGLAIVKDDSADDGSVFTLRTPIIKTENRALRVAEGQLANLRRRPVTVQGEIPRVDEMILSWDTDSDNMKAQLAKIESYWAMETA